MPWKWCRQPKMGGGGLSLKCEGLNPSANYVIWERNVITKFTRSSSIKNFWTKSVVSILKRNNSAKKCVNGNPWRTLKNKIVKIRWLNFFILCIFPRFIGAVLLSVWSCCQSDTRSLFWGWNLISITLNKIEERVEKFYLKLFYNRLFFRLLFV